MGGKHQYSTTTSNERALQNPGPAFTSSVGKENYGLVGFFSPLYRVYRHEGGFEARFWAGKEMIP